MTVADAAAVSVEAGRVRYNENRPPFRFSADFVAVDCFGGDFLPVLAAGPPCGAFDVVSCQFAWHYCFVSEERARQAIRNIAARLRPGGTFVGTTPDSNRLVKRWRESETPGVFANAVSRAALSDPASVDGEMRGAFGHECVDRAPS